MPAIATKSSRVPVSSTKSALLWTKMRDDILSGRFEPGQTLPSQRELCEQHRVTPPTVWAAMTRLVQEGLIVRQRGRGTFVSDVLPRRETTRTLDIVRVRSGMFDALPLSMMLVEAFTDAATDVGWAVQWHHVQPDDMRRPQVIIDRLRHATVVLGLMDVPPDLLTLLRQEGRPVVGVLLRAHTNTETPSPAVYPQLHLDRAESGRMAIDHLVCMGRRRIAYVGTTNSSRRTSGVMQAMIAHGLPLLPGSIRELDDSDQSVATSTADHVAALLKTEPLPDAICFSMDYMAPGAIDVIQRRGLRIPGDIAAIACDGSTGCDSMPVPLTSVQIPCDQVARRALQLATEQLEKADGPLEMFDPTALHLELIVRASSGGTSTENAPG